jgi:hypothetical protein
MCRRRLAAGEITREPSRALRPSWRSPWRNGQAMRTAQPRSRHSDPPGQTRNRPEGRPRTHGKHPAGGPSPSLPNWRFSMGQSAPAAGLAWCGSVAARGKLVRMVWCRAVPHRNSPPSANLPIRPGRGACVLEARLLPTCLSPGNQSLDVGAGRRDAGPRIHPRSSSDTRVISGARRPQALT